MITYTLFCNLVFKFRDMSWMLLLISGFFLQVNGSPAQQWIVNWIDPPLPETTSWSLKWCPGSSGAHGSWAWLGKWPLRGRHRVPDETNRAWSFCSLQRGLFKFSPDRGLCLFCLLHRNEGNLWFGEIKESCLTSSQDGGAGRHTVPLRTTKRRTTTI